MRNVIFVWEADDGKLRVTWPSWNGKKVGETDDQFLERVAGKLPKPIAMRPEELPKKRTNRDKWKLKDGKIIVE